MIEVPELKPIIYIFLESIENDVNNLIQPTRIRNL